MGRTILCNKCRSTFDETVLSNRSDPDTCPVCGASLLGEDVDHESGLLYFDEIATSYRECPELNGVQVYCSECGEIDSLELDLFDTLVDGEYVILKEDTIVKCEGCGKEHKPRRILYKKKEEYAPTRLRCPICNSIMVKKIKVSSKFLAAATIGVFALPYNSKTYECKNCNYRF